MKKLAIILVATMMLLLVGCATTGVAQADYDDLKAKYDEVVAERDALLEALGEPSVKPAPKPVGKFDEATVLSQLEVTEYSYSSSFWHYAFLVIKNNSEHEINISVATKFYNAADELIGAKNADEDAVAPGSEIILYFMPDEKYAHMEYEMSVDETEFYESAVADLSYESVTAKEKEIVSVTNNGSEAADFVEGYALFFLGDKVVGYESTYFTDDDSELKPGKTITKEMDCYEEYDSVRFFFTGRRYK